MCVSLLNKDCYVYIISVRSRSVHAKQLPIRTSNIKPKRAEHNCASRVYPAKWDILNTLVYTQLRSKLGPKITGPPKPESNVRNRPGNWAV